MNSSVSARAKTQLSLTVAAALAAVDLFYDLDGVLMFVRCVMRFNARRPENCNRTFASVACATGPLADLLIHFQLSPAQQ